MYNQLMAEILNELGGVKSQWEVAFADVQLIYKTAILHTTSNLKYRMKIHCSKWTQYAIKDCKPVLLRL